MEKTILVGNSVTAGSPTSPVSVPDGAIAIFNADTGALVAAGDTVDDAPRIYIARGVTGGNAAISPVIEVRGMRKWEGKAYQAPARHVMTIGFTGSGTSAIAVSNDTEYDLIIKELSGNFEPFPTLVKSITSAKTGATGAAIAQQMATLINADAASRTFAEVLVDVAATAFATTATITTVNGSPVVVISNGASAPAVGANIRIGGTTAGFPIYRVLGVAGTVITLSAPYWSPSQVLGTTTAAVAGGILNAAPVLADEAGLRFTAKEFGFVLSVGLDGGFLGTPVIATTAFVNGTGTGAQVKLREKQLQGSQAHYNRAWLVQPTLEQTNVAKNFDAYHISYAVQFESSATPTQLDNTVHEVIVFMDTASADQKTVLKDILNPLFASTALQFPDVTV